MRLLTTLGLFASLLPTLTFAQNVGIGTTTPNAAAALDITATGKGLLIPRLDSATRVAISSPPAGLMVYQNGPARAGFYYYTGATWVFIPDKARAGDNLGNHTATQNLNLQSNAITGIGNSITGTGIGVRNDGGLNIGQATGGSISIGYMAGVASGTLQSVFIGNMAGLGSMGSGNQCIGFSAGASNSGAYNTFSGYQSGTGSTVQYSDCSGYQSGYYYNYGTSVTLAGYQSGFLSSGSNNTFSGGQSGWQWQGGDNIMLGYQAGYKGGGHSNIYLGSRTGYAYGNGSVRIANNILIGDSAGFQANGAVNNHFIGVKSGFTTTTGSNNVFDGYQSGQYNTTGSNNTALGYNSGPASGSGTLTNATALGANVSLTTSNTVVLGNGANVGIGTSAPAGGLHITTGNAGAVSGSGAILNGVAGSPPNLELRGSDATVLTSPYIDFAETSGVDYTTRLISLSGTLNVSGNTVGPLLKVNGGLQVAGSVAANIRTLTTGTVADNDYTVLVGGNISWGGLVVADSELR